MTLLLFIYGMAGYYLFGDELPLAWGSIAASMMSLIILLTLENFPIYLEEALAVSPFALPFMISYVFIIVFTVLNLLVGIVLNAMDEARVEAKNQEEGPSGLDLLSANVDAIASDGEIDQVELKTLKSEIQRLRTLNIRD